MLTDVPTRFLGTPLVPLKSPASRRGRDKRGFQGRAISVGLSVVATCVLSDVLRAIVVVLSFALSPHILQTSFSPYILQSVLVKLHVA